MSTIHPIDGPNHPTWSGNNKGLSDTEKKTNDLYLQTQPTSSSTKKSHFYAFFREGASRVAFSVSQIFQKQKIACDIPPSPQDNLSTSSSSSLLYFCLSESETDISPSLEDLYQTIISCKTRIPLEPGQSLTEALEELQDKAIQLIHPHETLDSLYAQLENPYEVKNYAVIKEKISLVEKMRDLQALIQVEEHLENMDPNELQENLYFEDRYEALHQELIENPQSHLEDPIDKIKSSLIKFNNVLVSRQKQELLTECMQQREHLTLDIKKTTGKSRSVASGKDTAFKAVYLKYLSLLKSNLEIQAEQLDLTIQDLTEKSSKHNLAYPDNVYKKAMTSSQEKWANFCESLYSLPSSEKRGLVLKINRSSCSAETKELFKDLLTHSYDEDPLSIPECLSVLDLAKELRVL